MAQRAFPREGAGVIAYAMKMLLAFALLSTMGAATATPIHPPDGTYSYRVTVGDLTFQQSTVVITSDAATVTVQESTSIPLKSFSAVAISRYDCSTLRQIGYRADVNMSGAKQSATAIFGAGKVTLQSGAQRLDITAGPTAPLEVVSDNLVGTMVMLPALLEATQANALTLAVTAGGRAVLGTVQRAASSARPSDVPASDRSVELDFGSLSEIYWYEPQTFVVDDVEIPAQTARIALTSRTAAVTAIGSPAPVVTPVPTPPPHFISTDVAFTSADGTRLAGTLTVPSSGQGPFPAVVLVAGSGPQNRDEAIGPNDIFLQLSNALSNAGFVVLRYDKRGVGKSAGSSETRTNLIADARSAFEFVQAQKDVDAKHVYLLGHSEGGLLVPSVAASDPHVAGIILMAAPALPLWQLSMEQVLEMTPPAQRAAARREELAQLAEIRRGKKTGAGMAWYRSEMDVDPIPIVQRVRVPLLILQGEADLQVLASDLPRLVDAAKLHDRDVTVRVFPNDTHLFMKLLPGEARTLHAEVQGYFNVAQRIDSSVLETIISWLRRQASP